MPLSTSSSPLFLAKLACGLAAGAALAQTSPTTPNTTGTVSDTVRQTPLQPGVRLDLYWENDGAFLRPGGTDRHYTNGFGFSLAGQSDWAADLSEWMLWGQDHQSDSARAAAGIIAGHEIYTPEDITTPTPDPEDWPYAGYLFVGGFLQRQAKVETNGIDAVFDHVQLDVGVVGPNSQADHLQRFVHKTIGDDDPRGWSQQLDNEITAQFTYRRKWRIDFPADADPFHAGVVQLIPRLEARLGTVHVDGTMGATLRYAINPPDDFGAGFLRDPASAAGAPADTGWMLALFADASVRLVAHNIFLDGGTFQSGPSVDKEPIVGQVFGGLSLGYRFEDGRRLGLNYGILWETAQARSRPESDSRGLLSLTVQWPF